MDGHGNNKAKDTHAKGVCMGKLSSHQALVKDGATIAMSQTDICYTYDAWEQFFSGFCFGVCLPSSGQN